MPSLTWEGARDGELGAPLREQATQETPLWPVTTYCRLEQMCSEEQDTHCVQSSDGRVIPGDTPCLGGGARGAKLVLEAGQGLGTQGREGVRKMEAEVTRQHLVFTGSSDRGRRKTVTKSGS